MKTPFTSSQKMPAKEAAPLCLRLPVFRISARIEILPDSKAPPPSARFFVGEQRKPT